MTQQPDQHKPAASGHSDERARDAGTGLTEPESTPEQPVVQQSGSPLVETSPVEDDSVEEIDQDSEPTNTAPPGERPTDPGPIAEAAAERHDEA